MLRAALAGLADQPSDEVEQIRLAAHDLDPAEVSALLHRGAEARERLDIDE